MSVFAGFAIVLTEAAYSLWKKFHAINFGIYGVSQVGKTTLNHQLRTRGEVPDIKKRTVGLQRASRKQLKYHIGHDLFKKTFTIIWLDFQ